MRIGNQKKDHLSPINDVKKRKVFHGKSDKKNPQGTERIGHQIFFLFH